MFAGIHAPEAGAEARSQAEARAQITAGWAPAPARGGMTHPLLQLQATAGNRAVTSLLADRSPRTSISGRRARPTVQRCGPVPCDCPERRNGEGHTAIPVQRVTASEISTTGEPAVPAEAPEVLARGAQGQAVEALQSLLNATGVLPEGVEVDGVFGPDTEAAVMAFQEAMGLAADGIVGPVTNQTLRATAGPAPGLPGGTGPLEPSPVPTGGGGDADASGSGGPQLLGSSCRYNPGEKERSAADPGGTLEPAIAVPNPADTPFLLANTFGITGFTQGSADPKARHVEFMAEMTREFRLDTPEPSHTVAHVVGFTDCVDSFATNVGIRLRRAQALRSGLLSQGALEGNLGAPEASPEGAQVTSGSGERDRATNRAAVADLKLREIARPETPRPPTEETPDEGCERPSKRWIIEQKASAGAGAIAMGQVLTFHVTNVETGCVHVAAFTAAGLGAGGGVDVSIPSDEPPEVIELNEEVFAFELDGQGFLNFAEASLGVGFGIGKIFMVTGPLIAKLIDVGGLQIGEGLEAGSLFGHLVVRGAGRKTPPPLGPPTT